MKISRTYHYDSAHWLPHVPEGHKCGRMHGHTYQFTVTIGGDPDEQGWVMDFADLDRHVQPHLEQLDHRIVNDVVPNPTVEQQLLWWSRQLADLPLRELRLQEGLNNTAAFDGNPPRNKETPPGNGPEGVS